MADLQFETVYATSASDRDVERAERFASISHREPALLAKTSTAMAEGVCLSRIIKVSYGA
jgi:hypothetical protein